MNFRRKQCDSAQRCVNAQPPNHLASVTLRKVVKTCAIAAPGVRHRRDNGPIEYQVQPVPPPRPEQLGQLTLHTETIIEDGPDALAAAHREAARLSVKFGEQFETQWCLMTNWL